MKIIIKFFKNIISFITYPFRYTKMAFKMMKMRKLELQARTDGWELFTKKNKLAIQQWYKVHGLHSKPPIYYNQKDKCWYWNNRAVRRKLMKVAKKGHKKMASKRNAKARLDWKNKGSHLKVVK